MLPFLKIRIEYAVFGLSMALLLWSAPGIGHYLSAYDPNFQLCLGRQVLFDKFPCVGLFTYYGPMVAFTSAAGLALWNCVVPEVVICAIGYSAALTLVFALGRRVVPRPVLAEVLGLALAVICFLFLARFHKWYYWLFPLIVLYCFSRFLESDGTGRRWIILTGISAGIGWLYRFEIGLVCTCAIAAALLAMAAKSSDWTGLPRRLSLYLGALAAVMALWFIALVSVGGFSAARDYLVATFVGGAGTLQYWAIPIPRFNRTAPFSQDSSHAIACYLLIFTYVVALPWAVWQVRACTEPEIPKRVFTLLVALVGTGLLPQGLYRADISHFLQVLPLMLLTACFLVTQIWEAASSIRTRMVSVAARSGLILYIVLIFAAFKGIAPSGRSDMGPFAWDIAGKYCGLAKGVEALPEHPVSRLVTKIRELTPANTPILVPIEYMPQILSWAERPMSGILPIYCRGMLDSLEWRVRNFKAVEADPPEIVVVEPGMFAPDADPQSVCRRNPELCKIISTHYSRVVYRQGDEYIILARD